MLCSNHPNRVAHYRCRRCQKELCEDCVEHRVVAGRDIAFCLACRGETEELVYPYATPFWGAALGIWFYPLNPRILLWFVAISVAVSVAFFVQSETTIAAINTLPYLPLGVYFVIIVFGLHIALSIGAETTPGAVESRTLHFKRLFISLMRLAVISWPIWLIIAAAIAVMGLPSRVSFSDFKPFCFVVFGNHKALIVLFLSAIALGLWLATFGIASMSELSLRQLINPYVLAKSAGKDLDSTLYLAMHIAAATVIYIYFSFIVSFFARGNFGFYTLETVIAVYYAHVLGALLGWRLYELRSHLFPYVVRLKTTTKQTAKQAESKTDVELPAPDEESIIASPAVVRKLELELEHAPNDTKLLRKLIEAYQALGRTDDALSTGARLISVYIRDGRFDLAASLYEELYAYNKKYTLPPFLMQKLGEYYEKNNRWQAACLVWRNLAVYQPDSPLAPQALLRCAKILAERLGKQEAAITALRKLLQTFPDSPVRNEAEELLARLTLKVPGMF